MAQAVSARVAGSGEHRDGEFASGSRDRSSGEASGAIQVELPKGQVRITGSIDAESLRVVLECLLR